MTGPWEDLCRRSRRAFPKHADPTHTRTRPLRITPAAFCFPGAGGGIGCCRSAHSVPPRHRVITWPLGGSSFGAAFCCRSTHPCPRKDGVMPRHLGSGVTVLILTERGLQSV